MRKRGVTTTEVVRMAASSSSKSRTCLRIAIHESTALAGSFVQLLVAPDCTHTTRRSVCQSYYLSFTFSPTWSHFFQTETFFSRTCFVCEIFDATLTDVHWTLRNSQSCCGVFFRLNLPSERSMNGVYLIKRFPKFTTSSNHNEDDNADKGHFMVC